jgi:dihydrofolate reductase
MQIWFIVAHSHLQGISFNGKIPWACKKDTQFMRDITTAPGVKNGLLMGRTTFESIGRALPARENIVVTAKWSLVMKYPNPHLHFVSSISAAIEKARTELALDVLWIFGGAAIYDSVLEDPELRNMVDGFFITNVPERQCDTFIRTNLYEFILERPEYRNMLSQPGILEQRENDGTYELNAYTRLPASQVREEWAPILNSVVPETNQS